MLILTRKTGEKIIIKTPAGDIIKVNVLRSGRSGGEVKLGFDAEKCIEIHREEIWNKIYFKKQGGEDE